MPPKKRSGKKKKGGKQNGKGQTTGATTHKENLSELNKEYYHLQIKDLENRLGRYQKRCDELSVKSTHYYQQYEQMSANQKEIVDFLNKSLEQKADEIKDLHARLVGLQQTRESEKENFQSLLQKAQSELQETKDQLTSENMILSGKLAGLEEFRIQKDELLAKFATMEEKLKEQEKEHDEVIYNMERKQVVDKDRLKKEMVMRVNQVAAEFRKVSNKQMAETTKRTIRENVSINSQLGKMSDKTLELIQENDELKAKDKQQRQQIDLLEANEKELAKKNHSNQKVIKMLTEKCKSQEEEIAEFEMREQEFQDMEAEADLMRQQLESSREELMGFAKNSDLLESDLDQLRRELLEEKRHKRKLEKILSDCAQALKTALTESTTEDVEETPYEQMEKRDTMLENLLVLLNSAASLGFGPKAGDLGKKIEHDCKAHFEKDSKMPGSGKGVRRGEMPPSPLSPSPARLQGTLPHYQLGDLGLIPRPAQFIPFSIDKMRDSATTSRLGSLKKILTKSVGTQTISAPKAMFYADQLLSAMPNTSQVLHDLSVGERDATLVPMGSRKIAASNTVY